MDDRDFSKYVRPYERPMPPMPRRTAPQLPQESLQEETQGGPPPLPPRGEAVTGRRFPQADRGTLIKGIRKACTGVFFRSFGTGSSSVIILPEAWEELRQMICYGQRAAVNCFEQQYQGMGHVFSDGERTHIVVSHFLYIYSASRSAVHASVVETERDNVMLDRLAAEREIYCRFEKTCNRLPDGRVKDPFLEVGASETVLFGHTHPDLGCFFSPPDRKSGYATKTFPAATFVCDPIRGDMKAMVGMRGDDAQVIVAAWGEDRAPGRGEKGWSYKGLFRRGGDGCAETAQAARRAGSGQEAELGGIARQVLTVPGVRGRYRIYRGKKGDIRMKLWIRKKGDAK